MVNVARDLKAEEEKCIHRLGLRVDEKDLTANKIRGRLRSRELDTWGGGNRGKGVHLFGQKPKISKMLTPKGGLTNAEFTETIKLLTNTVAARAIPGRSRDGTGCRRCRGPENYHHETVPHILGSCPYGSLLRNERHNAIRSLIANALREKGREVYEEIQCVAEGGSIRRIDIIIVDRQNSAAIILDPTVRYEDSIEQPMEVDREKKDIYEATIPFFKNLYGVETIEVVGLLVGARGTITNFFEEWMSKLGIGDICVAIAQIALRRSIHILRNHLYGV